MGHSALSACPTHLHAEPLLLSAVCVCVGGGGSAPGVPDLHCLMMLYGKLYSLFSHNLFLASVSPPRHFLPLHLSFSRFLSFFYFYFPALITSFLFCVLTTSASCFFLFYRQKNITHYYRQPTVQAVFLCTAPDKHTRSLSGRYLKNNCARKDKPEHPEDHKSS